MEAEAEAEVEAEQKQKQGKKIQAENAQSRNGDSSKIKDSNKKMRKLTSQSKISSLPTHPPLHPPKYNKMR